MKLLQEAVSTASSSCKSNFSEQLCTAATKRHGPFLRGQVALGRHTKPLQESASRLELAMEATSQSRVALLRGAGSTW